MRDVYNMSVDEASYLDGHFMRSASTMLEQLQAQLIPSQR
jgi:hypothetical protein